MKKFYGIILCLAFMAFKTNVWAQTPDPIVYAPITIENGTLKFSTILDYEQYADNTKDRQTLIDLSSGRNGFTALAEVDTADGNNDEEYPEFLKMVLNTDKIFAFSNYLMKIDLVNHRGLLIDGGLANAYQSLVNDDLNARGIMVFNDDVDNAIDVIEQIENGTLNASNYQSAIEVLDPNDLGMQPKVFTQTSGPSDEYWLDEKNFRPCRGAHHRKANDPTSQPFIWITGTDPFSYCPNLSFLGALDSKVTYERFIVYFSLQSKVRSIRGCSSTNWITAPFFEQVDLKLNGVAKFSKRCEPEQTLLSLASPRSRHQGAVREWRPYESTRSLSKYDFSAVFGVRLYGTSSNFVNTGVYHIVYGY